MIKYYGEIGQGKLDCDPEEVVVNVFDDMDIVENYKYPFIVHVFTPKNIVLTAEEILEHILQELDENYGDPDGDYSEPTKKMLLSAKELAMTIKREYTSYMCETTSETIKYSQEDVLAIVGRD